MKIYSFLWPISRSQLVELPTPSGSLTTEMVPVDIARIVVFSIYLAVCVPWCFYAAWRWHKNSHLPEIKERYPTFSLIAFLIYPIATISVSLGRIFDDYPCALLAWQDYFIVYVTFLVYMFRAFIYYFKYEWVHERLNYFEMTKGDQKGGQSKTPPSTFFHRHRYLMKKDVLIRIFAVIVSIEGIAPLTFTITRGDEVRVKHDGSECGTKAGWGFFIYVGIVVHLLLMFVLAFKIRPARDIYNVRGDLKLGMIAVLGIYVTYIIALFTHQFGTADKFPFSSLVVQLMCVLASYISAWRPIQLEKYAGPAPVQSDSEEKGDFSTASPISKDALKLSEEIGSGNGKGSVYKSKPCQHLAHFLSDPVCRAEFQSFVVNAYAIENWLFFDAAIDYHLKYSNSVDVGSPEFRNAVIKHALKIYKEYFRHDAVLVVNVSHQCVSKFQSQFDAALAKEETGFEKITFSTEELLQVFDQAFAEVLGMLHDDLFRKFKNTPQFSACSAGILTHPTVVQQVPA
jgi:hypothetical protein